MRTTIMLAIVAIVPGEVQAQDVRWPGEGTRIRVVIPAMPYLQLEALDQLSGDPPQRLGLQRRLRDGRLRLDGVLVGHESADFRLRMNSPVSEVEVATQDLNRLEVYEGRSGHPLMGAVIGAIPTGLIGYGFAAALADHSSGSLLVKSALVGALPGALLGLLIGSAIKTDSWRTAYIR